MSTFYLTVSACPALRLKSGRINARRLGAVQRDMNERSGLPGAPYALAVDGDRIAVTCPATFLGAAHEAARIESTITFYASVRASGANRA